VGVSVLPGDRRRTAPSRPVERARRDVILVALFVAALLALTFLPYVYAYRSAPVGKVFMGILLNVPDTAQYLSWAREESHSFLIGNLMTSEPGAPVYFNLFWFVVGRLAVALHLGFAEATQVIRPIVGAFFLGTIYWFAGFVTRDRLERWTSFLVVTLGSGLGVLWIVAERWSHTLTFPLDVYTTEPNTFLSVLAFPLQAMADGMLVVILGLAALAFERKSFRLAAVAGVLSLLLGLQHGYDLIIAYAVVGVTGLLLLAREREWLYPLGVPVVLGAVSAPAALYVFLLARLSPIWRGVLAQYGNALVFTPQPAHLLILLGLPLIVLVIVPGDGATRRGAPARELLLRTWLVIGALLVYLPTDFQIKMLGGWQIPIGILAAQALVSRVAPSLAGSLGSTVGALGLRRNGAAVALAAALVVAVLPTTLYLYAWRFTNLAEHDYPYYLTRGEVAGLQWLNQNTHPSDVVLSSLTIGQYVPYVAGDHAFLAHWAETLDYFQKQDLVSQFFNPSFGDANRRSLLLQYGVRYVFYSASERALGSFDPSAAAYLQKVYSDSGTTIYQVRDDAAQVTSPTNSLGGG
jgi:hypothetical protein